MYITLFALYVSFEPLIVLRTESFDVTFRFRLFGFFFNSRLQIDGLFFFFLYFACANRVCLTCDSKITSTE